VVTSLWRLSSTAVDVLGAHAGEGGGGVGVAADGAFDARAVDALGHGRSDTDQAHRLVRGGEGLGQGQHVRLDLAPVALEGEVAQVLRCAEAAGDDQRVEVLDLRLAHVLDLAAGDARGFHQHVAALRHFLAGEVVDHVVLGDVRGEALHLRAALGQAQQGDHAFVDLGAVVDAAAGEDDGNFLVHAGTPGSGLAGGGDVAVAICRPGCHRRPL